MPPNSPSSRTTSTTSQDLRQDFALEAAQEQVNNGRYFYLEAPATSEIWMKPAWIQMMRDPSVMLMLPRPGEEQVTVSSNCIAFFHDYLGRDREEESADDDEEDINDIDSLVNFYFGAKLSGDQPLVTQLTRRCPEITRFLNRYLSRHGAIASRSSFCVSQGALLDYRDGGDHQAGDWRRGRCHDVRESLLNYDPRQMHGVEPWTGQRWSISILPEVKFKELSKSDQRLLFTRLRSGRLPSRT